MYDRAFNLSYQISQDHIKKICNQIPHTEKVTRITTMNAGLSAFLAKLDFKNSTTPSWVIRVINPNREKKYEREMGALLQAHQKFNVPTPKVIFTDNSRKILSEPYYIYEFLPGDTLGNQITSLTFAQKKHIYADLGQTLARMHLDQRSESGAMLLIDDELVFEPFEMKTSLEEDIYQGQLGDIECALQHAFKEKYDHLYNGCERIWNTYKDSLRNSTSLIGFCHNDLLADNLIINEGKVEAIIDWEQSCYYGILYDLARTERGLFRRIVLLSDQERQQLQEIFLRNYQKIRPIEDAYWDKRVAHHIVQAMDDLSGLPDYQKRMVPDRIKSIEQNLIHEIEEYCEKY